MLPRIYEIAVEGSLHPEKIRELIPVENLIKKRTPIKRALEKKRRLLMQFCHIAYKRAFIGMQNREVREKKFLTPHEVEKWDFCFTYLVW